MKPGRTPSIDAAKNKLQRSLWTADSALATADYGEKRDFLTGPYGRGSVRRSIHRTARVGKRPFCTSTTGCQPWLRMSASAPSYDRDADAPASGLIQ
jgi:hypothetical protein